MTDQTIFEKMKREMEEVWNKALKEAEGIRLKALQDKANRDAEALCKQDSKIAMGVEAIKTAAEEKLQEHIADRIITECVLTEIQPVFSTIDVSRQQAEDALHSVKVIAKHFVDKYKERQERRIDDIIKNNPPSEQVKQEYQAAAEILKSDVNAQTEARLRNELKAAQERVNELQRQLQERLAANRTGPSDGRGR